VGVSCIGVPICAGDEVVGAISVSLPTARLDAASRRRLVDLVRKTAGSISARLKTAYPKARSRQESP
jgi:DNA-binding IclR family transcriptional regulator